MATATKRKQPVDDEATRGILARPHICTDCGKTWRGSELAIIEGAGGRVPLGIIAPTGECPACGSLCFLRRDLLVEAERWEAVALVRDFVKGCLQCGGTGTFWSLTGPHGTGRYDCPVCRKARELVARFDRDGV